jgi:UDP-N-acetylmuramate dehydrogenase
VGDDLAGALRDAGAVDVRADTTMGDLTTLRVGGPVAALVTAESDEDLQAVSRVVRDRSVPVVIVGRGSNLLVPDAGWPGIAVTLGRGYRGVEVDGTTVRAGAAEPLPSLAVNVADAGLGGFAWAAAVPGSLGGAVRMNAGAHGSDMSQCLVEVEVFRLQAGMRETWAAGALGMRYRRTDLPGDAVVVAATLSLAPASSDELRAQIAEIRQWRRDHQPINEPNCGSVFTNPPGDSAGRLIDAAGGKGLTVGGARVSERHANFIVTRPGATAADVHALIVALQNLVEEHAGIRLHPEVVMVGDHPGPVS